ncbi:G-type lectin S-receptor-like serine/threonine-protein kinase LECRK1 [Cornus florida]|uniref:G-type lectin S-receptor-like serine/threonine-protein kinase LECRK1 n=1 Tax=Cornus florida TaxID=4283 RepID=UPI0028991014|nr:G-type lectin S-receptor-like serine/threonine-protein kinase LECRK1 [Cornus florida]
MVMQRRAGSVGVDGLGRGCRRRRTRPWTADEMGSASGLRRRKVMAVSKPGEAKLLEAMWMMLQQESPDDYVVATKWRLAATAQQRNTNMSIGSFLSPISNSSLVSLSGRLDFGFYPKDNGFAIGIWFAEIPPKTVVWTANRDDPPISTNATLTLTLDGKLILQQLLGGGQPFVNASQSVASTSILDSGNFVLYNSDSKIIWQSFDYPTNTLLPGQLLPARDELVSGVSKTDHSIGNYRVKMQYDGNLVMYPVGLPDGPEAVYWAGDTYFAGDNATLTLDGNGLLYVFDKTGTNIKNITNGGNLSMGKIFRSTMDADGLWRLYSYSLNLNSNWTIEWSAPDDRCDIKGMCGINGFCVLMDQEPSCTCPPGFIYINQGQKNLGCNQNFSTESYVFKNGNINYTIYELDNAI